MNVYNIVSSLLNRSWIGDVDAGLQRRATPPSLQLNPGAQPTGKSLAADF